MRINFSGALRLTSYVTNRTTTASLSFYPALHFYLTIKYVLLIWNVTKDYIYI